MKKSICRTLFTCAIALTFAFAMVNLAKAAGIDEDATINSVDAAAALNSDRPEAPWITDWWMLDGQIINNGGFAVSAPIDWLSEGSGGAITQNSISTLDGLLASEGSTINLPDNGGELGWGAFTIDPADGNNMSSVYGLPAQDNFDTYAIIVIVAPSNMNTVMSPAHDDHAQIWVNGEKCYNNSAWTGAATQVDYDIDVSLNKGANVLLYRCGESGGSDYFNLYFQDNVGTIYPTATGNFPFGSFATAVDALGKLPTVWGDIKKR